MDPRYIIVQAGGKGSRMQSLTRNKPKALVPVNNLPMIFHLFRKYPDRKFIVIGDYKYDVLAKYLKAFAEVDFQMVCASGHTGTCSGMREALSLVPEGEELLIIWCDLVLPAEFSFPADTGNYVGISNQVLANIMLWTASRYLYKHGKNPLFTAIPAIFLTYVCVCYFMVAPPKAGGLSFDPLIGHIIAATVTVSLALIFNLTSRRLVRRTN